MVMLSISGPHVRGEEDPAKARCAKRYCSREEPYPYTLKSHLSLTQVLQWLSKSPLCLTEYTLSLDRHTIVTT